MAMNPDGTRAVVIHRRADSSTVGIQAFGPDGIVRSWAIPHKPVPVEEEHFEEAADLIASFLGAVRGKGAQESTSTWSAKIREEMWVP